MAKRKGPHSESRKERAIHDAKWIRKQIDVFAREILDSGMLDLALIVGIRRRGAELARRVQKQLEQTGGRKVPYGALDITLYRDDVALRGPALHTGKKGTVIDGPVDHRVVFLIDDVICTGRTIRAALDELTDFGRPGAVRLFSLIDRGGRELPIQPDRVAERLSVPHADRVDVRLEETDGEEGVYVVVGGMR
ncbi:MAG: bifunctional pyr operon transcriptional regulator/uracil phosphoribosyltransferase PyrR [Planctomycetota bacterium]|nr:bifunctional pyr operon transcriptional regulator/uracil phosphoribosyltransferase PyrR [Planctomycetota bacterium]